MSKHHAAHEEPTGILKLGVIVREETDGTFSAKVPALPGVFTCGDTREELMTNVSEAIEGWLLAMLDLTREEAATEEDGGPHEVVILDLAQLVLAGGH